MQLVVFDIDDTLTRSMVADTECFVRSLEDILGFRDIDTDWSHYQHVTDAGIVSELFERHKGRPPTTNELSMFQSRFVDDLRKAVGLVPIEPVPGAQELLNALRSSPEHEIALATGAWRASALLKLGSAGLNVNGIHITSSDDHYSRTEILNRSVANSTGSNGNSAHSSVVYVGDGVWDATTCRKIGLPLIGIGVDQQADKLIELGAYRVFPDLTDQSRFFEALHELDQKRN